MLVLKGTFVVLLLFLLIMSTYVYIYNDFSHGEQYPCEPPFIQVRNSCYYFSGLNKPAEFYKVKFRGRVFSVPTKLDWLHTLFSCETFDRNAKPISIETEEEMEAITSFMIFMGYPYIHSFWSAGHRSSMSRLGMDPKSFKNFYWYNSPDPLNFTKWIDGYQPQGTFPNAFCMNLIYISNELFMSTANCHTRLSYICEMEPQEVLLKIE